MTIKVGSSSITKLYAGSSVVSRGYQGSNLVYTSERGTVTSVGGSSNYGGNVSGSPVVLPAPAGCVTNDYLLAFISLSEQKSATGYGPTPSGWTRLYSFSSSTGRTGWVYGHAFTSGETEYTFASHATEWGTSRRAGMILAARGVDLITPIDAIAIPNPHTPAVATSVTIPDSLNTVTPNTLQVLCADVNTSSPNYGTIVSDPATWSRPTAYVAGPVSDASASATWMHLFTKPAPTIGLQSGTSWTWTGATIGSHKIWHLALKPGPI